MQQRETIKQLISTYLNDNPEQSDRVQPILGFIHEYNGEQLYARNNFTGHITGSAYILNKAKNAMLLLEHKFLQRWLQPGGHVEAADDTVLSAALREAVEETGIGETELQPVNGHIFDIDSHPIPANTKKGEPAHIHHDIAFLFVYEGTPSVNIDMEESTAAKWVPLNELATDATFSKLATRLVAVGTAGVG